MKIVALILLVFPLTICAQTPRIDSLKKSLMAGEKIQRKIDALNEIAILNLAHSTDSMERYARKALELAIEAEYQRGIIEANKNLGVALYSKGLYSLGFKYFYDALRLAETSADTLGRAKILHNLGGAYFYQGNYRQSLKYVLQSMRVFESIGDSIGAATSRLSVCECYERLQKPDSSIYHCQAALPIFVRANQEERVAHAYHYLAEAFELKGDMAKSNECFRKAIALVKKGGYLSVGVYVYKDYGNFYLSHSNADSSFYYLHKSLDALKKYDSKDALKETYMSLSSFHEKLDHYDSALFYLKLYSQIIGPDVNKERDDQLAALEAHYNLELQQKELALTQNELRHQRTIVVTISFIALLVVVFSIVTLRLYFNLRNANKQLRELVLSVNEKNEEITAQSANLAQANAEIQRMNENLEERVNEKTLEVKTQNQKLIEYAYFNAHKVRGPIARLLGLVNVIRLEQSVDDKDDLLGKIADSAHELDEVVREINRKLDH